MNVSPIMSYNYNRNSVSVMKNNGENKEIQFKGRGDEAIERIVNLLKTKVTKIDESNDFKGIYKAMENLVSKYQKQHVTSAGVFVVPDEKLTEMVGNQAGKFNLIGKKGICVAVGDKYGPIEIWNKAYEANLILLPKSFWYSAVLFFGL